MRAKIDPKTDQAVRRFLAGIAHDYEMAVRCCMVAAHAAPTALTAMRMCDITERRTLEIIADLIGNVRCRL